MVDVPIFYINLDKRADRRAFMERQFAALGLSATRIRARTPAELSDEQLRQNCLPHRPLGLSPEELACTMSHIEAWRRIATSGNFGLVLEDDAIIGPRLLQVLESFEKHGLPSGLVKLDTTGASMRLGDALPLPVEPFVARRLHSITFGACAYLLTGEAAARLLSSINYLHIPADLVLFDPFGVPCQRKIDIAQIFPAVAAAADFAEKLGLATSRGGVASSDLELSRRSKPYDRGIWTPRDRWTQFTCMLDEQRRSGWTRFVEKHILRMPKERIPLLT